MYKLEICCKPEQKDKVLRTLHDFGVDRIGNYDHCWAMGTLTGSHRALLGSSPVFGAIGEVENYPLMKIEINVEKQYVKGIVARLKECLGWEEPLINVIKLHNKEFDFS